MTTNCQCNCGESRLVINDSPLLRIICHCTICQAYTGRDYSDVTLFLSRDVQVEDKSSIHYKKYKKLPPALDRGKCKHCEQAFVEHLSMPLAPGITFIPTPVLKEKLMLPDPRYHVYYDRRVADSDDDLPKHSGSLKSQAVLISDILPAAYKKHFSTV